MQQLPYSKILFSIIILFFGFYSYSQDISIDTKKFKENEETDFTKNFKIIFKNNKKGEKIKLVLKKEDGESEILKELTIKNENESFEIPFTASKNELSVRNSKMNSVSINQNFVISYNNTDIGISNSKKSDAEDEAPSEKSIIPYWDYLKDNNLLLDLKTFKIPKDKCCDDCEPCDKSFYFRNNRIIYDAKTGLTYFIPIDKYTSPEKNICAADWDKKIVSNKNKIKLNAGDPVVLIIENVNPAIYDISFSDSSFLTNNETTGLLESLLLSKSEDAIDGSTIVQVAGGNASEEQYLKVKTGLILVKAEMEGLLLNLRLSSPFLHNCVQNSKREALEKIENYPAGILKKEYAGLTFLQLVDIFLNQETEDSTLNHQLKTLYGEFVAGGSYKLAYRYPQLPAHDFLNFNIEIKAKPVSPYPSLLSTQMKHPTQTVYIKNFFKVDVSSGLYMGNMKDQVYTLYGDTAMIKNSAGVFDSVINVKRIKGENLGTREIGFASYLHFYYKFSTWFNPALTIGAGINFGKTIRPRYFTGVSILIGNNNRLSVSGGLVWGNYDEISNRYKKTGNDFDRLDASESKLDYKSVFGNRAFFSLSYNIPFLTRKKGATDAKPNSSSETPTKEEPKK